MMSREEEDRARGGMLCDEMGLGKTWTTLGLIGNTPTVKHTLLFCPLAVVNQWVIAGSEAGFGIWRCEKNEWVRISGKPSKPQLFIVNYDKLLFTPSLFKARIWHRIVCDEAHIIRNPETTRFKEIKKIASERWWFLSGTPIVNKQTDLVSLLHLMDRSISYEKSHAIHNLEYWMNKFALQRTVQMVSEVLPNAPKSPVVKNHILPFETETEATFYRAIQGVIKDQLKSLYETDMNMAVFLLLLLRMRQISVHPQVYINAKRRELKKAYTRANWEGDSTKTKMIHELFEKEEKGRGWVVFCNFHDEIVQMKDLLSKNPSVGKIFMYDASMSSESRQESVDASIRERLTAPSEGDGRHTVFLVQILCGGTGLNLQHMDRVVFMSPWWTAALMDQAIGRVVRMGQMEQVIVHHLCLEEEEALNIDDFMMEKVEAKRELCALMLENAQHITGYEENEEDEDPTN